MQPEDVLIVGAGPAGIAAAIQLQRSRVPFIMIEKERVGGLLWNANLVENYPGFPKGISGPKLANLFEKQLQHTGVKVTFDRVIQIEAAGDDYLVRTDQTSYRPRYLIVATGTKPRAIPITVPDEVRDKIFSEVYPLLGARDQHIVIVGAGDAAFDYGLNLAKNNMISITHRGDQTKCLPLLWERAVVNDHITYQDRTAIEEVDQFRGGKKLLLRGQHKKTPFEIECDYLIYAIGREPDAKILSPNIFDGRTKKATSENLYLVGDLANGYMKQTAIAVGDGLRAAMRIHADIKRTEAGIV